VGRLRHYERQQGQFTFITEPFAAGEVPHLKAPPPTTDAAIAGGPTSPGPAMKAPQEQESLVEKIGDKLSSG
jgi:hypothetical protein